MKKLVRTAAIAVATSLLVTSCGSSEPAGRTRNAALTTSTSLPYSCAQLITDQATAGTSEIRFSLCDDAEMYSIITPTGTNGSVNDKEVQGGEEIVVPIVAELNGPSTKLVVRTTGALADDFYHPGVHIYAVSLASADAELVGAESSMVGTIYPKVDYRMPMPQRLQTYRAGPQASSGGVAQYASYIDEVVLKWALVTLATCHSNLAQAAMARISDQSGTVAEAQMVAKRLRNRDWFVALNSLRGFVSGFHPISLCSPNTVGVNVIAQGVERGFTPLTPEQVADSNDPVALVKSLALLRLWEQIVREECPAREDVTVDLDADAIEILSNQIEGRLGALSEDTNLTQDQRSSALRASRQIDVLDLLKYQRQSFGGVSTCVELPAGYAVSVQQTIDETIEAVSATLPPASDAQSQDAGAPEAPQSLAEIVTNPTPVATVPSSQLSWPAAASSVVPTLRVGRTMTKTQLAARSGLPMSSKSTVKLTQVASSKKFCVVAKWGVKAVRVGTCKVRVSVAAKGKKTLTRTMSLSVTK